MARASRQTVTIRHVAAEAGVSLQTVSRVMNDEPNVRPEMQEKVRVAVAKLGYVPSIAARRLSGSRSYLILALNDRDRTIDDWASGQGSDWIGQMLYGGMLECAARDYRMIFELVDTHSSHVEREVLAALSALRPDGVILTPPHSDNPAILTLLSDRNMPFARIGSRADGPGFTIRMDDAEAGEAATRHLAALGHRRIGFIMGDADYRLSHTRAEGYARAVRALRLDDDPALLQPGDFGFASGERAMEALLALPGGVTAVIASSDKMTLGALHVAHRHDLSVPGDLALVSFDDTPVVRYSVPPMTAVTQPIAPMAARAAELLIEAAAGRPPPVTDHLLPFTLSVRGSTVRDGS
jgi:LacI family transcriptional regulator